MVRKYYKLLSLLLACILTALCFVGFFSSASFAMPRVENELLLDFDAENGYEGKYVIAYNPSFNTMEGLTTGIISDQMKNISYSISESERTEPYIVDFEQRISAIEAKRAIMNRNDVKLFSQDEVDTETIEYTEGDTRIFAIYEELSDYSLTPVEFTLAAKGEHCYIWILDGENYALTADEANTMAVEYDEKIYNNMRESFGEYIDPEESGKLNILVYDIQDGFGINTNGYTCGYFNFEDLYYEDTFGNNAAMIHIDTYPTIHWRDEYNIQEAYSTIVHELQHLINFSQYLVNPNSPEEESSVMSTWLNECCSLAAEELVYPNSVASSRLSKFTDSDNPYAAGRSLYAWNDDILNYSMMYLFGQYIRLQSGSYEAFKRMLDVYAQDSAPSEKKAVEAAVENSALDGFDLSEIVLAFRIAMIANEVEAYDGIYGFCGNELYDSLPAMTYSSSQTPKIYGGGAIVIETTDGVFYPAKNASDKLQYAGISFLSEMPTATPEPTLEVPFETPTPSPTTLETLEPSVTQSPAPAVKQLLTYLSPSKEAVLPGGNIELKLSAAAPFDTPLTELRFEISLDAQLFDIINVSIADEFASLLNYDINKNGTVVISLDGEEITLPNTAICELAKIELKAISDIESTVESEFAITDSSAVIGFDMETVEIITVNPNVKITVPMKAESDCEINYDLLSLKVDLGTTVDDIAQNCIDGIRIQAFKNEVPMESTDKAGTGTVLVFSDENGFEESFTVILLGDNNCDASINSRDIAMLQREIVKGDSTPETTGIYLYTAFDISADGKINSRDLSSLQRVIANGPVLENYTLKKTELMAASPAVSVSVSKEVIAPGETVTVTVAFEQLSTRNISVMELIIPINMDAFSFVQDSAQFFLEKSENTIGDAIFLSAKNQFFCNYVDVSSPIPSNSGTICTFKLTAKQNIDNVIASFDIADTSFMCDAYLNDIAYTSTGSTVTISTEQGLKLVGGSTYEIDTVNRYLTNVPDATNVSTVKSNFTASGTLRIEKSDGTVLDNNDRTATGYEVKLYAGSNVIDRLFIVINGDVTGDGLANSRDIATLQRHITGAVLLDGVYFAAGDITGDIRINSRDLASLQRLIAS